MDGLNQAILAGTYNGSNSLVFGTRQLNVPYVFNTVIARTSNTLLAARQQAQVTGLEVYPNPARQMVEVRTATAGPVQVLDAVGRLVRSQLLATGQTQVALGDLAPSCYTLLVQQGEARSYHRLTIAP